MRLKLIALSAANPSMWGRLLGPVDGVVPLYNRKHSRAALLYGAGTTNVQTGSRVSIALIKSTPCRNTHSSRPDGRARLWPSEMFNHFEFQLREFSLPFFGKTPRVDLFECPLELFSERKAEVPDSAAPCTVLAGVGMEVGLFNEPDLSHFLIGVRHLAAHIHLDECRLLFVGGSNRPFLERADRFYTGEHGFLGSARCILLYSHEAEKPLTVQVSFPHAYADHAWRNHDDFHPRRR